MSASETLDKIDEGVQKTSKFSKAVSSIGDSVKKLFSGDKPKRKKSETTGFDVYSDYRKSITIDDIKALRSGIKAITEDPIEYGNALKGLRESYSNKSTPYMKQFWVYWFSDVGNFFWKSMTDDEKIAFKKLYEDMTGDINAKGWYPKGNYVIPINGTFEPSGQFNQDLPEKEESGSSNQELSDYDKDKNENAKVILIFLFVLIVFVGIIAFLKRFIS